MPYYPSCKLPNLNDGVNDRAWARATTSARRHRVRPTQRSSLSAGVSGTAVAEGLINSLTGPVLGVPVDQMSDVGSLLYAPAMAGTEVSVG